ncbi:hypothetical protein ACNKHX_00710 [Shigella flexneri]
MKRLWPVSRKTREPSHRHLAFIKEILLDRSREESRRERSSPSSGATKEFVIFLVKIIQKML